MIAAKYDIIIEQQTSFLKVFRWLDLSRVPVNLTLYDVELEIRALDGTIIDTYSTANGLISTGTDGKATIIVGADVIETYTFAIAKYSLRVYLRTGSVINESGGWTSTAIDVDDGSSGATITANGGTPFSSLASGDFISVNITTIGAAESSGIYKLGAVTDTILTISETIEGTDFSNTCDITIWKLDPENFFRLFEGDVRLSKEQALIGS